MYWQFDINKIKEESHVYFEPFSRNCWVLSYYTNKPLYYDITVDLLETPKDLMTFSDGSLDFTVNSLTTALENQNSEEVSNPMSHWLWKILFLILLKGKAKKPNQLYFNFNCEELGFPSLFLDLPSGSMRQTKLSWSKYISQRLLNYTQRFASNVDYLFLCQTVLQLKVFRSKDLLPRGSILAH